MIVGTGIDACDVDRVRQAVERHGVRFLQRVFTAGELAYCESKRLTMMESLAVRFAAKEAAVKALGTGIASGLSWQDVEVMRLPDGRPTLVLHGRAAKRAAALGVKAMHLSLSHSRELAIASVVLEG